MDETLIKEAIRKVIAECEKRQAAYTPIAMRPALTELGFGKDQADAVIAYCASHGFDYCLDPTVSATHYDPNNPAAVKGMITDYPSSRACYWGPDQLKSRLNCVL